MSLKLKACILFQPFFFFVLFIFVFILCFVLFPQHLILFVFVSPCFGVWKFIFDFGRQTEHSRALILSRRQRQNESFATGLNHLKAAQFLSFVMTMACFASHRNAVHVIREQQILFRFFFCFSFHSCCRCSKIVFSSRFFPILGLFFFIPSRAEFCALVAALLCVLFRSMRWQSQWSLYFPFRLLNDKRQKREDLVLACTNVSILFVFVGFSFS